MYIDYSNPDGTESLPFSQFNVSTRLSKECLFALVVGAIITTLAAIAMAAIPFGTTGFWVVGTEIVLGSVSVLMLVLACRHRNLKDHQSRVLHHASCIEDYKAILKADAGVSYSFNYLKFVNIEKIEKSVYAAQTIADKNRCIYLINGEPTDPEKEQFGDAYYYANQAWVPEMMSPLMSRYENQDLHIHISQRAIPPREKKQEQNTEEKKEYNTKFNLIYKGSNRYLETSQLFQITQLTEGEAVCLKYIKAIMWFDFQTGDAVLRWTSPQDDLPTL